MAGVACLGLVLPALLIGVVLVGLREPALAQERQQQQMDARLDTLARALAELVWSVDAVAAHEVVEAVMKSPDVVRVQVVEPGRPEPFVDVERIERLSGIVTSGERDIVRRGQLLGLVRLEMNDSTGQAALRDQRRLFLWMVGAQVALSLALILALLNSRVVRPLRELGRFAGDIGEGRFGARLQRRRSDEIGQLGDRLEDMRDALQRVFEEQRAILERLKREEASTERLARFYAALSRSSQMMVRSRDEATLYAEICSICVETGQAAVACLWLREGDSAVLAASAGPAEVDARSVRRDLPSPVADALFDGRTRVAAEAGSLAQVAALPVRRGGAVAAALSLYSREEGVFDDAVVQLLGEMASDLSFALDNIDRDAQRLAAQHEVELGYERFRRVFGALPVAVSIATLADQRIVEVNAAVCDRYGLRRDEMIGRRWADLTLGLPEAERAVLAGRIRREGLVRDFETSVRLRSGELREVLINGERIEFGGDDCLLTISTDITARKRAEHALRESEARLTAIVETVMDGVITIDGQGRIVVFNHAATRIFRVEAAQVIGQTLERFIPPALRAAHAQHVQAFAATGHAARRIGEASRLTGLRADGEEFPLEATISRSGSSDRVSMTVIVRDVTALIEAERAREARLAAEAASRAKTEFLSRMSHELRTPLNAVLGFSQLLQGDTEEPLSPRQRLRSEGIAQAGWHLLALINDVLDMSRIESGQLPLQPRGVAVGEILDEVVQLLHGQAEGWGVALDPAYRRQPPQQVWVDPLRLRQVMLNVVGNAVKYNRPGGSVRIEATAAAGRVALSVVDTGLGMTSEQLAHLFEPFNRLGRERGGIDGTGIGMALTRELLALMHGDIEVASEPGSGTTVRIALPPAAAAQTLALVPPPAPHPREDEAEPEGTVLYIEDNPVNMLIVEQMLARWPQVKLAQATDGRRGIALARELRPNLVLLDMRLPDMEGTEVLAALRADAATSLLRVVALSASAMDDEVAHARRCGAFDYWTKPLDFDRFMTEMRRLLPVRAPN